MSVKQKFISIVDLYKQHFYLKAKLNALNKILAPIKQQLELPVIRKWLDDLFTSEYDGRIDQMTLLSTVEYQQLTATLNKDLTTIADQIQAIEEHYKIVHIDQLIEQELNSIRPKRYLLEDECAKDCPTQGSVDHFIYWSTMIRDDLINNKPLFNNDIQRSQYLLSCYPEYTAALSYRIFSVTGSLNDSIVRSLWDINIMITVRPSTVYTSVNIVIPEVGSFIFSKIK